MALNPKLSNAAANAEVDALSALLDGGTMEIRSGTQPATPDDAPSDGALLATVTFGSPAFGSGVAGVASANAITSDPDAVATGTAAWYRCKTSGGAAVHDGSIGAGGTFNLVLNSASIQQHAVVSVGAFVLTASKG